jgi:hypothetical protein
MRIGRLEIGISRKPRTKAIAWSLDVSLTRPSCGCIMLELGPIHITWLSSGENGCYSFSIFHIKRKKKAKKGKKK